MALSVIECPGRMNARGSALSDEYGYKKRRYRYSKDLIKLPTYDEYLKRVERPKKGKKASSSKILIEGRESKRMSVELPSIEKIIKVLNGRILIKVFPQTNHFLPHIYGSRIIKG